MDTRLSVLAGLPVFLLGLIVGILLFEHWLTHLFETE